jgi:hypothetical protein
VSPLYFAVEPSSDPFYADPVRGIFLEETTMLDVAQRLAEEAGSGTRVVRRDLDVDAGTVVYVDVYVAGGVAS